MASFTSVFSFLAIMYVRGCMLQREGEGVREGASEGGGEKEGKKVLEQIRT